MSTFSGPHDPGRTASLNVPPDFQGEFLRLTVAGRAEMYLATGRAHLTRRGTRAKPKHPEAVAFLTSRL